MAVCAPVTQGQKIAKVGGNPQTCPKCKCYVKYILFEFYLVCVLLTRNTKSESGKSNMKLDA